ncbi:Histone-lysine N-methyltransferase [Nymphaea thermarum]|nr:Histone-lysine N-methyltransferase [Nymphaea thermarum]
MRVLPPPQRKEEASDALMALSSQIEQIIRHIEACRTASIKSQFHQCRNQRMAEDQSVVGRRRIYYDQCSSEALICSDSEEEVAEPEEERHDFNESEDNILWYLSNHRFNWISICNFIRFYPSK